MMLTTIQIKEKCKVWAKEIWGLNFDLPIEVSGRMTRSLGLYRYRKLAFKIIPVKLQFAKSLLNGDYKVDTVDSVILRELCHWALSQLGQPFDDGHPVFEKELMRIGASTTRTIKTAGIIHEVKCACCGKVVVKTDKESKAKKYLDPKYRSKCCRSGLVLGNVVNLEDTYVRKTAMSLEIEDSIKAMREVQGHVIPNPTEKPQVSTQTAAIIALTINDIFDTNERMTNAKMEALLKEFIINSEAEKIKILKNTYKVTFNKALRYLGERRNQKIKELVG